MAKAKGGATGAKKITFARAGGKKRTSIGASTNSRPVNKSKRLASKAYRGQGRV